MKNLKIIKKSLKSNPVILKSAIIAIMIMLSAMNAIAQNNTTFLPDLKSNATSNSTQIILVATPAKVLADRIAKASITAKVKDLDGNPVEGVEVTFITDFGTLNQNTNTTNSEGNASTILTSYKRENNGTAKVTASVNNKEEKKSVEIKYYVLNTYGVFCI